MDADILLIDEILAVGDAGFQKKCFDRLNDMKKNGTTIVLVSHALGQVEEICDRSIWLNRGKIMLDSDPKTVNEAYLKYINRNI